MSALIMQDYRLFSGSALDLIFLLIVLVLENERDEGAWIQSNYNYRNVRVEE